MASVGAGKIRKKRRKKWKEFEAFVCETGGCDIPQILVEAVKSKKILDISKVPVDHVRLAWLTHVVDGFDLILISKEQSKEIFGGWGSKPWELYRDIPIKVVK